MIRALLCALLLLGSAGAGAVIETYEFSSPALEERYRELSTELRCPKCQNQNIADSNAPIAQDLRRLLYEQLEAGASDDQIRDYMVARYGEFVRYRPRFGGATALLWLAPLLLLLGAMAVAVAVVRSRRRGHDRGEDQLSASERERLREMLDRAERDS